jgi:UDP-glucose 4-epimerase
MRAVVTGGAGFIGGHLAQQLLHDGIDVVALDRTDPDDEGLRPRSVAECRATATAADDRGRYEYVRGDIRDETTCREILKRASVVYHLASLTGVRRSTEHPLLYDEVNVNGTLTLLEAARNADLAALLVASSSSVYGKPQYLPYDERHPTMPVSPYGVSKLAEERYALAYHEVYGLPTVALRYFTVYGPRMRPNMAISNFVSHCMNGLSPVVYGDGTQTRDFTHVADVVDATRAAADTEAARGETMNVGSTDNIDVLTLAKTVRDAIDPALEIEFDTARDSDAEHTHADVSKARELLGYEPTRTIREGVREFIDWYRENRTWYEPLVLD